MRKHIGNLKKSSHFEGSKFYIIGKNSIITSSQYTLTKNEYKYIMLTEANIFQKAQMPSQIKIYRKDLYRYE